MILAWIHFAPGGHADLIRAPVVTDDAASGMRSVTGTVDWNSGVEAGGVEPIVIVRRGRAVPSPVMVLQGRVIPLHAGIHVAHRDAVAGNAKVVPGRVGADDGDVPFHVGRRPRETAMRSTLFAEHGAERRLLRSYFGSAACTAA